MDGSCDALKASTVEARLKLVRRMKRLMGAAYKNLHPGQVWLVMNGQCVSVVVRRTCPHCGKRHHVYSTVVDHPKRPLAKLFRK